MRKKTCEKSLLQLTRPSAMLRADMEPGLVTLAKIVGLLAAAISTIPLLFLLVPGDRSEPKDSENFDTVH